MFAIEGGFHLPYLQGLPLLDAGSYAWAHRVQYLLLALFGLGLATRAAGAALCLLQGWVLLADQMNFRNHTYFFLLVLALLTVSPCDDTLSVRAWLAGRRGRRAILHPAPRPLTAQRLIQLQVSIVYVYAALMKLNPQYLGGTVIARQMQDWVGAGGGQGAAAGGLAESAAGAGPSIWIALAWGSILLEVFLGVALWWPRSRPLALALGVAFHLALAVVMGVWTFSIAYVATYLLFLDPDTLPRAFGRMVTRRSARRIAAS